LDRNDWLTRLRWLAVVGTLLTVGLVSLVWHTAGEQGLSTTGSLLPVAVGIGLYSLAFLERRHRQSLICDVW